MRLTLAKLRASLEALSVDPDLQELLSLLVDVVHELAAVTPDKSGALPAKGLAHAAPQRVASPTRPRASDHLEAAGVDLLRASELVAALDETTSNEDATLAHEQHQRGVGLVNGPVAGTGTVPRPIDGASLPPIAVPTCSVPVAVAVGAGAPPIAVPVDARSPSPVAVPVGTMPVAAASYVNSPVVVVAGQPMAADGGASSSGLYGGKKI